MSFVFRSRIGIMIRETPLKNEVFEGLNHYFINKA